ncbi:MAG TPA: AAA family ATPase [Pyrinomonadaceae bacterium]|jgi:putative nucleotidyltransferase with HDIG domain
MSDRLSFPWLPQPPDYRLDWALVERELPAVAQTAGCPQDAVHHAEGDVLVHTRMVAEALVSLPAWRALPEAERGVVFTAALLHDVAKPACTRVEDGRVTSRGHSKRGAVAARVLLWEMGAPFAAREQVAALIRFHQIPFFLIDKPDGRRTLYEVSQTARCDLLALLAEADARGRVCADGRRMLDNVALFAEYAEEHECLRGPRRFANDHSRFLYFRREGRDPDYAAFDDTACEVVMMSGLPGAGKDFWVAENLPDWPVVSLDALRRQAGVSPTANQGPVVSRAREAAREFLRRKQGFVWNATNVSRQMRELSINLFSAYNARVRIVYVEAPEARLYAQNRERDDAVPAEVIRKLTARWETPDLTEAHRVEWVADSPGEARLLTF